MTERLADVVGQVEEAVLAAGGREPAGAEGLASLRTLIAARLEAGALTKAEVDGDETTRLRYLVTMLAHLREHELGLRLLRQGTLRAPAAVDRARLGALHGVLLAQLGRTAEARTRLEEALADAAGDAAESARIHSALAVLAGEAGEAEPVLLLLGNAEALAAPEPENAFAHAFARLRVALLREDADAATELGHTLERAADELIDRLPGGHPDALAAVADLAYARFRIARLTGHPDRLARTAAVLRTAARMLAAALGSGHPRTITAAVRQAECDRLLGAGSDAVRDLAERTARQFGPGHPLAVLTAVEAALAGHSPLPGAEAAARVLGPRHPLTVVLAAAARPEGADLARVSAQAALVLGVGHSVTRMLDERLRACHRTGFTTEPTHRTTDAIGTDTTAMSEPTAAASAATATASTDTDLANDAVPSAASEGAAPAPGAAAGAGMTVPPDSSPGAAPPVDATGGGSSATDAATTDAAAATGGGAGGPAGSGAADTAAADDQTAIGAATDAGDGTTAGGEPTTAGGADTTDDPATGSGTASPGEPSTAENTVTTGESANDEDTTGEPTTGDTAPAGEPTATTGDTAPTGEPTAATSEPTTGDAAPTGEPTATTGDTAPTGEPTATSEPTTAGDAAATGESGAGGGESGGAEPAEPADDRARLWDAIEKIKDDGGVVRGRVVEVVKGGLVLDVGVRAFLPASLVEMRRVRDLQPYIGRELEAKVLEMDRGRGNLVLSRRARLEETRSVGRSTLLAQLEPGQIRRGIISSVVNFGAFVDLGGVDGLISVAELSWTHHNHPSDVVDVGQEVEVEVLDVDQSRGRISLSLKATQQDPWPQFARSHPIGQIVSGRVTKLMPFGAFVRVDGLEGLVHVSELADHRVDTPDQVLRVGQDVLIKVTDIDLQRRRISLSMRQANAEYLPDEEQFDPVTYGMVNTYDAEGNYIYPEGFDAESGEWLAGFEEQRDAWERQYAEARERWVALGEQVAAARSGGGGYPAGPPAGGQSHGQSQGQSQGRGRQDRNERTAARGGDRGNAPRTSESTGNEDVDERLAALRERLSGGRGNPGHDD